MWCYIYVTMLHERVSRANHPLMGASIVDCPCGFALLARAFVLGFFYSRTLCWWRTAVFHPRKEPGKHTKRGFEAAGLWLHLFVWW